MALILVVDDEQSILHLMNEVLKTGGHEISLARDGSEATEKMGLRTYDLVISDLHMNRLSGIDVLQAAKERSADTEVLILTGHGSIDTAVKAMKMGAFDYLTKPIDIEEVRMKVRQALERRTLKLQVQLQQKKIQHHQEMIARDLKLAETVQTTLVPPPMDNEKIAVSVLHRPIIGVGGDYADIYFDGRDACYLTIVDVTGHGIAAALIVNRVSSDVRKLVREGRSPKEILYHLNSLIYDSFFGTGMFLTAFSCMINFAENRLSCAGGAHPPVLIWQAETQKFTRVQSQNPIIGFEKNADNLFMEESLDIRPNDKIFLFTDGLADIEDESGAPLGVEGISQLAGSKINASPGAIIESILAEIGRYRKSPVNDDIYLMAAQVK